MTQKEAIIKALEELGGRAQLADIYPRVILLGDFKEGSDKQATIRATLQRTPEFSVKLRAKRAGGNWCPIRRKLPT